MILDLIFATDYDKIIDHFVYSENKHYITVSCRIFMYCTFYILLHGIFSISIILGINSIYNYNNRPNVFLKCLNFMWKYSIKKKNELYSNYVRTPTAFLSFGMQRLRNITLNIYRIISHYLLSSVWRSLYVLNNCIY
jgi:hypothetical protein